MDQLLQTSTQGNQGAPKSQYKVIYLGDTNAGKTSCFLRLTGDMFYQDASPTLNVDLSRKLITTLDNHQVSLQLWDTPGQQIYRNLVRTYYRNAQGVFLCIDIGKQSKLGSKKIQADLEALESWMTELGQTCTMGELSFLLMGTKSDLGVDQANETLI